MAIRTNASKRSTAARGGKSTRNGNSPHDGQGASNGEGRRERNKREKRDRIVATARRLYREQGYANTTVQQIARGADIASGTLFLYAKSKEDLLALVFTDEMRELIEKAYAAIDPDAPFLEQIGALFKRFISYHARDVGIARELIREITFLSNRERAADLLAITQSIIDKLAAFAARAAARGELDSGIDRELLAHCLFSIYYQHLQTWLSGYVSRRRFEQRLAGMLELIVDGCRLQRP
jgi:AcrR family transcriptional regulator